MHDFAGTNYYNKERFELALEAAFCLDVLSLDTSSVANNSDSSDSDTSEGTETARAIADSYANYLDLRAQHESSEFEWDRLCGVTTSEASLAEVSTDPSIVTESVETESEAHDPTNEQKD